MNSRYHPPKFSIVLATLLLCVASIYAVPNLINYQGRVEADGVGFNGAGQFKFALVDTGGATTFWSNDNTSNAGSEPADSVSLAVADGAFQVLLGDATLTNMTAIPASVFADNDVVFLRVWFDDGTNGSQQLLPDRRIAAVGYAVAAGSVTDGAINSAMIADGSVTSAKLATDVGTFARSGGNISFNGGNVAVGTTVPNTAFHVSGAGTFGNAFTPGAASDDAVLNLAVGPSADGASNGIGFYEFDGFGMKLGYDGVGGGADNAMRIYGTSDEPLVTFSNGGSLGVGITVPTAKLDVAGAVRLSNNAATEAEGMVRWSGADFEGFNGTSWLSLTVPASVDGSTIVAGSVTATQLGAGAVTNANLAANAVQGGNIATGAVGSTQLANGAAAANLNASGQAGVPAGGMVLSSDSPDNELEAAGYVKIGELDATTTGDADSWSAVGSTGAPPSTRYDHTAVWTGSEMIVWGGFNGFWYLPDGSRYDPVADSWSAVGSTGAPPSARSYHTAVWTGSEMIVWGGNDAAIYKGDGSRYDPVADSWSAVASTGAPPSARSYHTAVWTGSEMIVWGGNDAAIYKGDGSRYDPVADTWSAVGSTGAPPSARAYHTAVWTGSEMIVWGGWDGGYKADGSRYDPVADSWSAVGSTGAPPSVRLSYTAVWTGSEMIVWGGSAGGLGYRADGSRYDPAADSWSAVGSTGAPPSARSYHTAVWTGSEMIVWGGWAGGGDYKADGSRYDPVADSWSAVASTGAPPSARRSHTAVWTGTEMIVWGGVGLTYKADGSRYLAPVRLFLYQRP